MRLRLRTLILNASFAMLVLASLSACGRNNARVNRDVPSYALGSNTTRVQFIQQFPVLNQSNQLVAPRVPTGGSPVGVILAFLADGTVSYCTATHIIPGRILTNAHCVESDSNPLDYYVLFYNNAGQQISTGVTQFRYVGSSQNYDFAILDIPTVAANQWATSGDQIGSIGGINSPQPQTTQVTIWSFDPISNYPNVYAQYNQHAGMIFNPKTCLASRTIPHVVGYNNGSGTPISSNQVNANYHIIMDNCNQDPIHGNSGSLITSASNYNIKFGVYHWGIGLTDPTTYNSFTYVGNRGQQVLNPVAGLEFYQVGTAFDFIAQNFPGLL